MRFFSALCLVTAVFCANLAAAQSFFETNQKALAVFNAGDVATALELTIEVVKAGQESGKDEPAAYLEALNNFSFLGTLSSIAAADQLDRAQQALAFASDTDQRTTAAGLTAQVNVAKAFTLSDDAQASQTYRNAALNDARGGEWHGQTLAAAVDLAFANRDHEDIPNLIEEMLVVTGGYYAQTTLDQLFERQNELEAQGDAIGVSALIGARILWVGAVQPDMSETFSHAVLWPKFFMNYEAENFGAAAEGLRAWAQTGVLSKEEADFIAVQAEQSLLLTQLEGYGDQSNVQLGYALLTLAFAEIAYPEGDHRIGLALREKAAAEGRLGQYEAANQTLQDAVLNLTQSPQGNRSVHLVLEDIAANAWQRGDLDLANRLFQQAGEAYGTAVENGATPLSAFDQSILLLNRARLQIERREVDQAAELLAAAQDRFATFVEGGTAKSRDLWHNVSLAQAKALLLSERDDADKAHAATLNVVEVANRHFPTLHPLRAMALTNAADQLFVLGDAQIAKGLLEDAYDVTSKVLPPDATLNSEIEVKLAFDALASGNRDDAITYLRRVVSARKSPEHRENLAGVSTDFEILSWLLFSATNPDTATVDEALGALQWTHVSQSAEALKLMEARLAASDPQIAVMLKRRQDALGNLALNRSALNSAFADGKGTGQILERQKRLHQEAMMAEEALGTAGIELTGQAPITPLSLGEIQSLLEPDEVVVTFLLPGLLADAIPGLNGSSNRAIAIRQDGYLIGDVPENSRGALNRSIDAFRCEMAISDAGCGQNGTGVLRGSMSLDTPQDQSLGFDWTIAHGLYETLFGGIAPLLRDQDQLIIVPPSDLLRLPFQALITAPQTDFDLGRADWLVKRHAVSVLPSFAALKALKTNGISQDKALSILGVGDPDIGAAPDLDCANFDMAALRSAGDLPDDLLATPLQDGLRLANVTHLRKMSRLPDASCELQAVKAAFGPEQSDLLLRVDATEQRIKALNAAGQLQDYDIIVFATHGLIAGETSAIAPGLVLTPPATASLADDGLLTAAEVANLTLSARLVILSACNTAAGRDASQEGLSGLASGFFQAGARSLMVTHWAVFSAASAEITTRLAKALADDTSLSNATALQRAVLEILEDDARPLQSKHPAYWAPFAIVGY